MSNDAKARSDPLIGQVIQGRHRPIEVLGQGGMGKVYLAEQLSIGRKVALKVLLEPYARDVEFLDRFRRQAQQAAALDNHPRIVTVYDFGEMQDGSLFIAMEYVAGRSLRHIITGPLPVKRAVGLAIQIAEGLHAVHRAAIVHRDVKPENILVRETGENEVIKLTDFGIARPLDAPTQITLMGLGTPKYIAPELIGSGRYSEQTDLYAWGIVLYEMLSGKAPFTAPTREALLLKHMTELPIPLRQIRPEIPVEVERLVAQSLEKKLENRPKGMQEVIARLRAVEGNIQVEVTGPTVRLNQHGSEQEKEIRKKPEKRVWLRWAGILSGSVFTSLLVFWVAMFGIGRSPIPVALEPLKQPMIPQKAVAELPTPPSTAETQAFTDHLHVGKMYLDRGEYTEAIAEFEAAKALAPGNTEILALIDRAQRARKAEEELLLGR